MIKCKVDGNNIDYAGEQPHIIFYIHPNKGQQYMFETPFIVGNAFDEAAGVKLLKSRGYEIKDVYAIEPHDVEYLRSLANVGRKA